MRKVREVRAQLKEIMENQKIELIRSAQWWAFLWLSCAYPIIVIRLSSSGQLNDECFYDKAAYPIIVIRLSSSGQLNDECFYDKAAYPISVIRLSSSGQPH